MRLAKLSYEQLSPEQKVVWDEVVAGPRKKMHGPFFIWLHSPDLLSRGEKLGLYARFQSSLPQRLSELCILMQATHWKCSGEWIDHAPIARASASTRPRWRICARGFRRSSRATTRSRPMNLRRSF